MKDLLVGKTGFVGSNLAKSHTFEGQCHSTDIQDYYSSCPDLCIYAGIPAAMFLANTNPEADLAVMQTARNNIRKINPSKLVLISSITVYDETKGRDEDSLIDESKLLPYGRNRRILEKWIREDYPDTLIVRLPALYGDGLKKNFLFDLHMITPAMLNEAKYKELSIQSSLIKNSYKLGDNGFYHVGESADKRALKLFFDKSEFNALSFTDSRSKYQFYNLNRLWRDISKSVEYGVNTLNLCTPPVSAKEVYHVVTGNASWNNVLNKQPFDYDLHSIYAEMLGGHNGYLCSLEEELLDIKMFMDSWEA